MSATLAARRRVRARVEGAVQGVGFRPHVFRLAEHVVVTRSEHIPRIQEAQASAYHVLVELVGRPA